MFTYLKVKPGKRLLFTSGGLGLGLKNLVLFIWLISVCACKFSACVCVDLWAIFAWIKVDYIWFDWTAHGVAYLQLSVPIYPIPGHDTELHDVVRQILGENRQRRCISHFTDYDWTVAIVGLRPRQQRFSLMNYFELTTILTAANTLDFSLSLSLSLPRQRLHCIKCHVAAVAV